MSGSIVSRGALHREGQAKGRLSAALLMAASIVVLAMVAPGDGARAEQADEYSAPAHEEALLVEALNHVHRQRLDAAIGSIESLVEKSPKFRLAHLVYGDLLLAKAGPIERFGNVDGAIKREPVMGLRDEALSRFRHHLSHPGEGKLPANLIQLSPSQRQAVVVDVDRSRLYLFENTADGPRLMADYYASSGKNGAVKIREGDRKTPVGVYFISDYIDPDKLPDFYGAGAFPIDYPNVWDRRLGKTGYGIWLHGVPSDTYSRPPRTSDGCVTLANADFESIAPFMEIDRTAVLIAKHVDWVAPEMLAQRRQTLTEAMESWRRDWESRDADRYLRHYAESFSDGQKDYAAWAAYKKHVNAKKRFIRVEVSDLSLLAYPGEPDMVVATFRQAYSSDRHEDVTTKRQYWRKQSDGAWRIVYEGAI